MSKIDLTSKEWCDLVFEGRNKKYGAYKLRQSSNKRHGIALLVVAALGLFTLFLPTLIKIVTPKEEVHIVDVGVTALSDLEEAETKEEEVQEIKPDIPPPPPLKSSIKFTPPVITKGEVREEDEMKSTEEIINSNVSVSIADVQGTDEVDGKDIAELNEIVQEPVEEKPYEYVEQMPQYPGGITEMRAFIGKNLRYPTIAQENGIQGKVFIRFVISKTGEVTNVEVIRSLDPLCDAEAVRVIKMMPKWIPGKQNGNAVPVIYTVPVTFVLKN
ncbi:MAG: energy transducer TonB [Prevotellaceae bacterium]|jgi:protein TonB|nr:energy transducer TonB [Prevotellaceae bacterium]